MSLRDRVRRLQQENAAPREGGALIESWSAWMQDTFGHIFTAPLAPFHNEYWEWVFPTLCARRDGKPLPSGNAFFAVWSRGFGKSTMSEIAPILAAAVSGEGLCVYVSGTQSLADMHLANIEELLSAPEVVEKYPELANPKRSRVTKMTLGWRRDVLRLANGYVIVAIGLDGSMRGLRYGKQRPGLIILDDIDDAGDSLATAQSKLETLTRKILPAGAKDTIIICAQNLIHRNGVINQIYEKKVPALAKRVVSGPYPAIEGLVTEYRDGRDIIVGGRPTWDYLGIEECQQFIDNSGLNAFLSEYQHEVKAADEGLVFPEYEEAVHVISESQFSAIYGELVPRGWTISVGYDHGATGWDKHPAVAMFVTTSSESSVLPGKVFVFAEVVGEADCLPDDMADRIKKVLAAIDRKPEKLGQGSVTWHNAGVEKWLCSPEETALIKTFRAKHGLPFKAAGKESIGRNGGLAQLHHYLRVDRSVPHPFKDGVMGAAKMYFVVADDQMTKAADSYGLKRTREEIANWRYKKVEMIESGLQEDRPVKFFDDAMDALRMVMGTFGPSAAPLATEEAMRRRILAAMPENLRPDNKPRFKDSREEEIWRDSQTYWYEAERRRQEKKTKPPESPLDNSAHWSHGVVDPDDDPWRR